TTTSPDSPTSTLPPTPRSQQQDLPRHQRSPSPATSSTIGRSSRKTPRKLSRRRKSVDIKPPTPASDQVTIPPSQPTLHQIMDWKHQEGINRSVRIDIQTPKRRFTLPKLFKLSTPKQFDPYSPPPPRVDREPTDDTTRGCSEDSTHYPRPKSQSRAKRNAAASEPAAPSRVHEVEVVPVTAAPVIASVAAAPRPDGIHHHAVPPSPSTDVPQSTDDCSPSPPSRPAHQASPGPQVPEPTSSRGPPAAKDPNTSRSRNAVLTKQKAMTDSNVGGTSRRDRRRWSKFWKAIARKLGFKVSPSSAPSPRKGKGRRKVNSESEVGSVVETLPAVDADDSADDRNAVGLSLDGRTPSPASRTSPPPARSRANSPYMERAASVEPHNVPLPGGESSLSLVSSHNDEEEQEEDGAEGQETPVHHHHQHHHHHTTSYSLSSPINASATSFTTESPLSVPSCLPDRSATTITLPTSVELESSSTCLDLSIEEDREEAEVDASEETLTEDEPTPTGSPCPPGADDPSASTHNLQLAATTAIPDDTQPRRNGASKFLFVKHSRWRGNSTLGHELGIRMFEEQYPTIESSLQLFSAYGVKSRERLPLPAPRATHDDDGDSIIDVVEDPYYDDDEFEDEPVGGWKEYFEEDEEDDAYYYYAEDHSGSTELGHEHLEAGVADLAFCAPSEGEASFVSEGEERGRR
ncbi:hypothetical protein FRB90_003549, partial [Tulasnella sp. 427]